LKRADRTSKLDGWKAWVEGEGKQMKARGSSEEEGRFADFLLGQAAQVPTS
jgi:hypothetical protein